MPSAPHTIEVEQVHSSEHQSELGLALDVARNTLEHRRAVVRRAFLTERRERRQQALRGLCAWYERICVDPEYDRSPPDDGLSILLTMAISVNQGENPDLATAYRLIRLAQEVATARASSFGDHHENGVERARLELAIRFVHEPIYSPQFCRT